MPQIWMTYEEIGSLLGCNAGDARVNVIARSLDRKKSRDGFTRAKLDRELAAIFVHQLRTEDFSLDGAIGDLRMAHAQMTLVDANAATKMRA